jgi:hypothetical protein
MFMATLYYVPVVQQFIIDDWVDLIQLEDQKLLSTQKAGFARDKLREFLTREIFWLSNEQSGECVLVSRHDGPIRIKWKTTLDKMS